jgi:hypothetical protein
MNEFAYKSIKDHNLTSYLSLRVQRKWLSSAAFDEKLRILVKESTSMIFFLKR